MVAKGGNAVYSAQPSAPAVGAFAITPSDATEFQATRGIYVGTSGDLAVVMYDGSEVIFVSAAVGYHPIRVTKVLSAGTTADDIVGLI